MTGIPAVLMIREAVQPAAMQTSIHQFTVTRIDPD